jgi:hypothetical protein
MSFLSGLWDLGSSILGSSTGSSLLKAGVTALALNQVSKSVAKTNATTTASKTTAPDLGVRLQLDPDTQHKIPVVYGTATLGGIITDAQITNGNKTMSYCITIAEKTGTKFSDTLPSVTTFQDIYWGDQRLVFATDGITVNYSVDRNGTTDPSLKGLVKVYCYDGGSASTKQVIPDNYTNATRVNAYSVMPQWTSSHQMTNLVFAIVIITYNKDKNVTQLGDMKFKLTNSMTLPGDCIYDYMTNNLYGAGIDTSEIYSA